MFTKRLLQKTMIAKGSVSITLLVPAKFLPGAIKDTARSSPEECHP